MTDGLGRVLAFVLTAGQKGDCPQAARLLSLPRSTLCLADAAYDSDALRRFLIERGTTPVIPNDPTRKTRHTFDRQAYRKRNIVGRAIGRLKDWRRVHTRYDKLAANFASAVALAAIITGWC